MTDIVALKAEIDDDPLTRGYSIMSDVEVAVDMNLVNRPDVVEVRLLLKFLLLDNVHQTDGSDTQDRAIWTRMQDVDALAVTPAAAVANPWGSTAIGNITEIQQIKATQLLEFFTLSAQGALPVDVTDSNFQVYLAGAQAAGCMSTTQETALLALSNNLQSRGSELGLGEVKDFQVAAARALP